MQDPDIAAGDVQDPDIVCPGYACPVLVTFFRRNPDIGPEPDIACPGLVWFSWRNPDIRFWRETHVRVLHIQPGHRFWRETACPGFANSDLAVCPGLVPFCRVYVRVLHIRPRAEMVRNPDMQDPDIACPGLAPAMSGFRTYFMRISDLHHTGAKAGYTMSGSCTV